jgi:hypothetical protein
MTDNEASAPQWRAEGEPRLPDIRRPRLMISTRCPHTIYEFGEYRYPEKKSEMAETSLRRYELPMKKDDHTPEALGRLLAGKYHSAAAQYGGGARVSHAKFLRGLGERKGSEPKGIPAAKTGRRTGTWVHQS